MTGLLTRLEQLQLRDPRFMLRPELLAMRDALPALIQIAHAAAATEELLTGWLSGKLPWEREELYAIRDALRVALEQLDGQTARKTV